MVGTLADLLIAYRRGSRSTADLYPLWVCSAFLEPYPASP